MLRTDCGAGCMTSHPARCDCRTRLDAALVQNACHERAMVTILCSCLAELQLPGTGIAALAWVAFDRVQGVTCALGS